MKKLNFDNREDGDDKDLIALLKGSTAKSPSDRFVEDTMQKFLASGMTDAKAHKPIVFPLYIMGVLGAFLVIPSILELDLGSSFSIPSTEIFGYLKSKSTDMDSWYITSSVLLMLATGLVTLAETRFK